VDDDRLIRETYQSILSAYGYVVEVAGDLPMTERLLRRSTPDYILLDLMMKPKSGWEILESIQNNIMWQKVPIIIFSGKVVYAHEIRRYGERVIGYIRKPTRLPIIIKEISRISSHQKEILLLVEKASKVGFSAEEISEFKNLFFSVPVLESFTDTLLGNFNSFRGEGITSDLGQDSEMKDLLLWINERKARLSDFTDRIR
jgi:DNA-binding response OmpR family regulator